RNPNFDHDPAHQNGVYLDILHTGQVALNFLAQQGEKAKQIRAGRQRAPQRKASSLKRAEQLWDTYHIDSDKISEYVKEKTKEGGDEGDWNWLNIFVLTPPTED
ncbi:MAG: hypothetical protein Q9182_006876, partial [Xanthomendoza sp. 2 TL-2023]